jgi:hypothetical protein
MVDCDGGIERGVEGKSPVEFRCVAGDAWEVVVDDANGEAESIDARDIAGVVQRMRV